MAVGFPTKANWAAGDVLTASALDDLAGTVNTVQYLKPWNQVLNSNMSVWQRGTSIAGQQGYTADRWYKLRGGDATGQTVSRQATGDTTNLPNIQYCARVQRNAADTSTQALYLYQPFETVNSIPFAGKTVVLSFYARAGANFSSASNALSVGVNTGTGTDQNTVFAYTGSASPISATATLTTTWQRFTYSGTISASATELGPIFNYTPVGTAGANDYFEITGVQLEQGSVANTYQPNQATYATELAACQRYYFRATAPSAYTLFGMGYNRSATIGFINFYVPVTMRPASSISLDYSSLGNYTTGIATVSSATLSTNVNSNYNAFSIDVTSTGLTPGLPCALVSNGTTSAYVGISSEL